MLHHRFWLRSLLVLGLLAIVGLPSRAQSAASSFNPILEGKKGGDPPRPKPAPGPREGGDED